MLFKKNDSQVMEGVVNDIRLDIIQNFDVEEDIIKRGREALIEFAKVLKLRIQKNWDNVIAITGEEGVGKSTAAIRLAMLTDPKFSIEKNEIIYPDIKYLSNKLTKELPKGSTIIVDEAIKLLYKQEWASKSQRFLNVLYALARQERKTTILCIPRFKDLNEYFRNHRVKFWIYIIARGVGLLFVRDWNPFTKDPWWMDENQKIIEKTLMFRKVHQIDIDFKLSILKKCKNFVEILFFDDLDNKTKKEYEEFIAKYKYQGLLEEEQKTKKEKILTEKIENAIKHLFFNEKKKIKEIATIFGKSPSSVRELLRKDPRYAEMKAKEKEKKKKKVSFIELLRKKGIYH